MAIGFKPLSLLSSYLLQPSIIIVRSLYQVSIDLVNYRNENAFFRQLFGHVKSFGFRNFYFPNDLKLELEYWAQTGDFSAEELHQLMVAENKLFTISPQSGKLAPGQSVGITFTYKHVFPGWYFSHHDCYCHKSKAYFSKYEPNLPRIFVQSSISCASNTFNVI